MKCKFCGEIITEEMKSLGACLNCGSSIELSPDEEKYYTLRAENYTKHQKSDQVIRENTRENSESEEELRQFQFLMEQEGNRLAEERHKARQDRAKSLILDGCWEYKVIKVQDQSGWFSNGSVNANVMMRELNHLGANGWHLVCAYTNELGKSLVSAGGIGINSTHDEHILIFERKITGIERFPLNELE